MNLKRLFFTFNSFQFFFSLLLWVPIFYEYQKRIGLNDTEIFRIQSIYYLVFCLLEIPTGFLADQIGYRLCLILGSLTLVLANVLVPFSPSYAGFLFHFCLIALSRSFVSGASSAYLYETLHRQSAVAEYKEAEGKARAYSLVGKVFCWALVGPMMQWHFTLPYWLTALNAAVGLVFAFLLPPLPTVLGSASDRPISVFQVFPVLIRSPILLLIMFQGVALFVLARICQVNLFQPLLQNKGFALVHYGMMMALMTIFEALGAFKSKWVRQYLTDLNAVFVLTVVIGISFYVMSITGWGPAALQMTTVAALCLFSYAIGISFPIQRQLINDASPEPKLRASLLSSESIIDRAVNSWVASSLGLALAQGNLLGFLRTSAWVAVTTVALIAIVIRTLKRINYAQPNISV
jgi:MFS family permease